MEAGPLNTENLFNLADLILDLVGRLLLDSSLQFAKGALRLVLSTWFHGTFIL